MGGAESLLVNVINGLPELDHHIAILNPRNDFQNELNLDSSKVLLLNFNSKKDLFKSSWRLRKLIKSENFTLVHSHLFWSTLITRFALLGLSQIRFFFSLHTVMSKDTFDNSKILTLIEKITYRKKQSIIAVSKTVLDDYNESIGIKGHTKILYNFISDKFFEVPPKQISPSTPLKIVAVGNIKPVKNYKYLTDCFQKLNNQDFQLHIYGTGDENIENELRRSINDFNLNIELKGQCDNLNNILPQYDLFVMPSKFEGFGIAPIEAMACHLPVALSNISVFKEIADDNSALYFDLDDPNSLIDILQKIKNQTINLNEYSLNGRARAEKISLRSNYLKKLKSIYLE